MQYKSISADGHVNEPPELWVNNLPEKFRERGPRVIETPRMNPSGTLTKSTMWPAPAVRSPTSVARLRLWSTNENSSAAEPVRRLVST